MLPRPPRAAIFDMDGTIFDTERVYARAWIEAGQALGYAIDPAFPVLSAGLPWSTARSLIIDDHGAEIGGALIEAWMAQFDLLVEDELVLKPGLLALLARLEALAIPCAIAT